MKLLWINWILVILFPLMAGTAVDDKLVPSPSDPLDAHIIYQDVVNFNRALKMIVNGEDMVKILLDEYINKGTPGLKIFIEKYGLSAEKLAEAIQKHPEDYYALNEKLNWLKTQEDSIFLYFKKLKHFIPQAIFPPTYYLVDQRRGIGSGSVEGQLITIEKEAQKIIDPGIKTHIIHELVHLNQLHAIGSLKTYLAIYNKEKSLLAITLREGVAEFFCELVTGKYTQEGARDYVNQNEPVLWSRFRTEMYGTDTGDWMWNKPVNPDQPRDTGYILGAKIVEYFYKHAPDIDMTVNELLSITEPKRFLEISRYPEKFVR